MRSPAQRLTAALAALLTVTSACDLSTPTEVQLPVELALDFCSNDVPVWFAYQNQGGTTTRVLPDAEGTFRFTATNRLVVVFDGGHRSDGGDQPAYVRGGRAADHADNAELRAEISRIQGLGYLAG